MSSFLANRKLEPVHRWMVSFKCHGFEHTKLYGEASQFTDEQVEKLMAPW
jgi:hypothetical protein